MDARESLKLLREQIDGIDKEMVALFASRMNLADEVASVKRDGNLSLTDASREQQVVDNALRSVDEGLKSETAMLVHTLIALSKRRQRDKLLCEVPMLPPPVAPEKANPLVGFQGVAGAWSEHAVMQLYPGAQATAFEQFEDVFNAVKTRQVRYGVVPIENSQSGAIGEVYDLLRSYGCYIVAQEWVDIRHCLLSVDGTQLEDVREVLSHPEGFKQCHRYLHSRHWDRTACSNTAIAAQMVAQRSDKRVCAIGSRRAAELNGLQILAPDIMDDALNRTRFIAIAEAPEYDEHSDVISVTFSTQHRSGALCSVLQCFMLSGINMTRIESRPAASGNYRFFVDLEANISSSAAQSMFRQASAMSEYFEVLGCYRSHA